MPKAIIKDGEEKMSKAVEALKKELSLIRTGRANPNILNGIKVNYYGVPTPLNQIASITVPEAQMLVIKPYDKAILKDIQKEIQLANLNLVPQNDGTVIRITFPPLTEERRKEFVKDAKACTEKGKIAVRNIRRTVLEQLKKLEKDGLISEDELRTYTDEVQKLTDKYIDNMDALGKEKEQNIMEI